MNLDEYKALMDTVVARVQEAEKNLKEAVALSKEYQKRLIEEGHSDKGMWMHCLKMPQQQAERHIKDIHTLIKWWSGMKKTRG